MNATGLGIASLIEHAEQVEAGISTEDVDEWFARHPFQYLAVVEQGRVVGLCGRLQVQALIGGRYGFALHSRSPIREHLIPTCLLIEESTPLRELLERALSRPGESFYQDVILIDGAGVLVGLVSTYRMVAAQSELVREQFQVLETQRVELETANAALEQSLAQQRQFERQAVAKEKAALVETLAGGIAHEINNKLMPIVGYTELLLDDASRSDDPRVAEYCRAIHTAALDSSRIIRQLLQLSRPTAHERTSCDLRPLVEQALTLVKLRLVEAGVDIVVDLPDSPVHVTVDGPQVKQVVMNLVLNAMDAMEHAPERRLTIRLRAAASAASLSIADTGCGIPADRLTKIFDPFFTTKAPNRGTGLGLGVSLSITQLHGGDIEVDSVVGRGLTFRVVLPTTDAAPAPASAPHAAASAGRPKLAHVSALIVEDDDAVALLMMRILQSRLGCRVERAKDGLEAVAALSGRLFDLVLSDIRMPGMNGVELLAWIHEQRPDMLSKLMFITGDASGTAMNDAIDRSGLPTVRKPVTADVLVTRVLELVGGEQPVLRPSRRGR